MSFWGGGSAQSGFSLSVDSHFSDGFRLLAELGALLMCAVFTFSRLFINFG